MGEGVGNPRTKGAGDTRVGSWELRQKSRKGEKLQTRFEQFQKN